MIKNDFYLWFIYDCFVFIVLQVFYLYEFLVHLLALFFYTVA
ncbi:MAG: hypothetical protein JWP12_791 [Bacteroidetes bacterium]|nr:hypothetical protein [Bacteroidota bacterium]